MGKHDSGKDSGRSSTDSSRPQGGKRESGDKHTGNSSDGQKKGK